MKLSRESHFETCTTLSLSSWNPHFPKSLVQFNCIPLREYRKVPIGYVWSALSLTVLIALKLLYFSSLTNVLSRAFAIRHKIAKTFLSPARFWTLRRNIHKACSTTAESRINNASKTLTLNWVDTFSTVLNPTKKGNWICPLSALLRHCSGNF